VILYHATQVILPRYGIHGNRHGPVNSEPRQEFAFRIYKAETNSIDRWQIGWPMCTKSAVTPTCYAYVMRT
jgi:hypothetical protein